MSRLLCLEPEHLGDAGPLRSLADFKGQELIDGVLNLVRTPLSVTADLQSRITPCQFGGNPDCSQCGCFASAGLKAIGDHRLMGFVPVRSIFFASEAIGKQAAKVFRG